MAKIDLGSVIGPQGEQGIQGIQGEPGKTAYQYAQEGGYTGTEAEFYATLGKSSDYATKVNGVVPNSQLPSVSDFGAADRALSNLSDNQTALYNIGAKSNPNLVDNWYFADPINQRGNTSLSSVGYFIDRWLVCGNSSTGIAKLADGYIRLQQNDNNAFIGLTQRQELTFRSNYAGKTITISALYRGSGDAVIYNYFGKFESDVIANQWGLTMDENWHIITATYTVPDDDFIVIEPVAFALMNGTLDIKAVKVELSDHQTLARQGANGNWVLLDPPPNKAEELLKCQRYFQRITSTGTPTLATGFVGNTTRAYIIVPFAASMRATPTVAMNGGFTILRYENYTQIEVESMGVYSLIGSNNIMIYCTNTPSGFGSACSAGLVFQNSSLDFSADL